jgi:hypothetical protein
LAQLFVAEKPDAVAEAAGINRRSLFGQNAGGSAVDFNLWSKACGSG